VVTVIFKIESEIYGVPPPKNLAAQKHQNFGFRDLIANISGREQDIVDRKTALETAITPLRGNQIWWTLVHKRWKIGPEFRLSARLSVCNSVHCNKMLFFEKRRCTCTLATISESRTSVSINLTAGRPSGWALPRILVWMWISTRTKHEMLMHSERKKIHYSVGNNYIEWRVATQNRLLGLIQL